MQFCQAREKKVKKKDIQYIQFELEKHENTMCEILDIYMHKYYIDLNIFFLIYIKRNYLFIVMGDEEEYFYSIFVPG